MDLPNPAPPLELHELPAWLVQAELARVLASPAFTGAGAHQRLLRYVVERALAGEAGRLKESVLGVEVFHRSATSFDPARDSIVRVEARRLRQRLVRHYAADGRHAALRFELRPGQYGPRALLQQPLDERAPAVPGEAQDLVERGEYLLRQGSEDGCRRALERFEQAAALEPGLASAHFGVARALTQLVGLTFEAPTPAIDRAAAAADRVLEIDPRHADALSLLAGIRHRYALDGAAAEALYRRAIDAAPGTAYLHHQMAFSLMFTRRFDEAEASLRLAHRIDPLNPSVRAHEALLALYRRDLDGAERRLRALLELQPQALALSLLGYVLLQRGDAPAALACYAQVEAAFPQLSIGAIGRAQALALAGRDDEARALVAELQGRAGTRYLPPYQLALVAARLGDADAAIALLQRALHERDPNFVCLPVDPGLDPLRADPRFAPLQRRCGLPDIGAGTGGLR